MPHINYTGPDGKPWPSSTELTSLLPKAFLWAWYKREVQKDGWQGWLKCNAASETGKKLGTAVHGHMESLTQKKEQSEELDNSLELAEALYNVVNPTVEEYVKIEPHLVSDKLKVHGTADIIYRKNYTPGLRIGDYKTSFQKDAVSHPLQLAIYAVCWNEKNPEQQIDAGDIFRIDKKTKRVVIDEYLNLKQYVPVIKALRLIWGYLNDKG